MVKIIKGADVFEVTKGAFDGIYSRQGYTVVNETVEAVEQEVVVEHVKTEAELFAENLLEKPLSQWNREEIRKFAELKGIDITGTKNAGEARERIKLFLEA